MIPLIIVASCGTILALSIAALIVIAFMRYEPEAETRHTRDCMALYRVGLTDGQCVAPHPTDWFSAAQDRIRLSNELDGQLWIQETK